MAFSSPLGLPDGSIRGILALGFGVALVYMSVVGTVAPETFIGLVGPFLGYYAASRSAEATAKATAAASAPEPLAPPDTGSSDTEV